MFKLFIFFTLIFSIQAKAQAKNYLLFVDCNTTDNYFNCFEIRETLKLKLVGGDQLVSSLEESNVSLKIRTRMIDEAAISYISVEQYYQLKNETTPFLIEIKKYRFSEVNISTTTDLVNHIAVHLARLRGITSLNENENGVVVTFGTENNSNSSSSDNKNWYLEPSASAAVDNLVGESSSIRVGVNGTFVRSTAKSKFILHGNASYFQQIIEFAEGQKDEYQELNTGLSTYYIRSLKNNRWSIALISYIHTNPVRDNIDYRQHLKLGVEYNLVPFVTKTEDMIFSIRYTLGPEYYDLKDVNNYDQENLLLIKHGVTIASRFILNKYNKDNLPLSFSLGVGASTEITSFRYAGVHVNSSLSYNISERISLTPFYVFHFANAYANQPKSGLGGVINEVKNAGRFASSQHHFHVVLAFAFGSPGLKNQDTRWTNK